MWRRLIGDPEQDNLVLVTWMKDKLKISTKDFEFGLTYVNGGNSLANLEGNDDIWKVRLEFHRVMFGPEGA